jgi:hypothetical protein
MKTTTIKQMIFISGMGFFLSACGGGSGGGGGTPPATDNSVPLCSSGKTVDVTGKTIKKVEEGAVVRIVHSADTKKTACMVSGKAEVIE